MRSAAVCLLFTLTLGSAELTGQQQPQNGEHQSPAIEFDDSFVESAWLCVRDLVLPPEVTMGYRLREWISRQTPLQPRSREKDLRRLDAIYQHAVYLADGDAQAALFALVVATLPYHTFPAQIPLIGVSITVPVSTESREVFGSRMAALPGKLFADSPSYLDRDKLPHFFGSAWLQVSMRNEIVSVSLGEMLELGEAVFKLEGSRDPRDIMINSLGIIFAKQLQISKNVLPSEILESGLSK